MNFTTLEWLNVLLPFAKWSLLSASLFLLPMLLEGCCRWKWFHVRCSAAQRHDAWALALFFAALSPVLLCILVQGQITIAMPQSSHRRLELPEEQHSSPTVNTQSPIPWQPIVSDERKPVMEDSTQAESVSGPATTIAKSPLPSPFVEAPVAERFALQQVVSKWISSASMRTLAAFTWIFVASILLIRQWNANRSAWRLIRSLNVADCWSSNQRHRYRIPARVRVAWSKQVSIPMLVGALRPVIVMPLESTAWEKSKIESVLLHEMAHVSRWDILTLNLSKMLRALLWFHPLAWYAVSAMDRLREIACDDHVLLSGKDETEYCGHLVDIAERRNCRHVRELGLSMARSVPIKERVEALLDASRHRASSNAWLRGSVVAILIAVSVSLAWYVPSSAIAASIVLETASSSEPKSADDSTEVKLAANDDDQEPPLAENEFEWQGTVVDETNNPVENCLVWGDGWDETHQRVYRSVRTNPKGEFRLRLPDFIQGPIRNGHHIVALHGDKMAWGLDSARQSSSTIRLKLEPTRVHEISCVDEQQKPVQGAKVAFLCHDGAAEFFMVHGDFQFLPEMDGLTDANGLVRFRLPELCQVLRCYLSHPDYADLQDEHFKVPHPNPVVMKKGHTVRVQVSSKESGLRLEETQLEVVSVDHPNETHHHFGFDQRGQATIHLLKFPSTFQLRHPRLRDQSSRIATKMRWMAPPGDQVVKIELAEPCVVTGRLLDPDTKLPVENCYVSVKDLDDNHSLGGGRTDKEGRYRISYPRNCRASVTLSDGQDFYLPASLKTDHLIPSTADGNVTMQDIVVYKRPGVWLQILDDERKPIPGAIVVLGPVGQNRSFLANEQGRVHLIVQKPAMSLRILHPHRPIGLYFQWKPSGANEETFMLEPDVALKGVLVDKLGEPIENRTFVVMANVKSQRENSVDMTFLVCRTNQLGEYNIHGLSGDVEATHLILPAYKEQEQMFPLNRARKAGKIDKTIIDRSMLAPATREEKRQEPNSLECRRWWNGATMFAEHYGNLVVVQEMNSVADAELAQLEWLQRVYQDYDVKVVGVFPSHVAASEIEAAIQRLGLTISIGLHAGKTERGWREKHFRIFEPRQDAPDFEWDFNFGTLASLRNAVVYPK